MEIAKSSKRVFQVFLIIEPPPRVRSSQAMERFLPSEKKKFGRFVLCATSGFYFERTDQA